MDMDMGTSMFQDRNMELARDFWYIIAGVVGFLGFVRLVNHVEAVIRCVDDVSPGSCSGH